MQYFRRSKNFQLWSNLQTSFWWVIPCGTSDIIQRQKTVAKFMNSCSKTTLSRFVLYLVFFKSFMFNVCIQVTYIKTALFLLNLSNILIFRSLKNCFKNWKQNLYGWFSPKFCCEWCILSRWNPCHTCSCFSIRY